MDQQISIYYVISNIEQAAGYRNGTTLFSTPGSPLKPYRSMDVARQALPDDYSGPARRSPVMLKFELPKTQNVPTQLDMRSLSQLGYLDEHVQVLADEFQKADPRVYARASIIPIDDMTPDISDKLSWLQKVETYGTRVERYIESQTELIDDRGSPDPELLDLLGYEFTNVLGSGTEENIHHRYGFTYDQTKIIDKVRGAVNSLGMKLGSMLQSQSRQERSPLILPPGLSQDTKEAADYGGKMLGVTMLSRLMRSGLVDIRIRDENGNVRSAESMEEHEAVFRALFGLGPDDLRLGE